MAALAGTFNSHNSSGSRSSHIAKCNKPNKTSQLYRYTAQTAIAWYACDVADCCAPLQAVMCHTHTAGVHNPFQTRFCTRTSLHVQHCSTGNVSARLLHVRHCHLLTAEPAFLHHAHVNLHHTQQINTTPLEHLVLAVASTRSGMVSQLVTRHTQPTIEHCAASALACTKPNLPTPVAVSYNCQHDFNRNTNSHHH